MVTPRPKPIMLAISYITFPDRMRTTIVIEMLLAMMITRYITFPDKVRTPRPTPIMLAMMITRLLNKMLKFSEVMLALKTLVSSINFRSLI